jgi:hypothetical protein
MQGGNDIRALPVSISVEFAPQLDIRVPKSGPDEGVRYDTGAKSALNRMTLRAAFSYGEVIESSERFVEPCGLLENCIHEKRWFFSRLRNG